MRVSAAICREQEARQLLLAESDALESRRKIASVAATAWASEAIEAEKREARRVTALDKLDAEITLEFALEGDTDAQVDEDRSSDMPMDR